MFWVAKGTSVTSKFDWFDQATITVRVRILGLVDLFNADTSGLIGWVHTVTLIGTLSQFEVYNSLTHLI